MSHLKGLFKQIFKVSNREELFKKTLGIIATQFFFTRDYIFATAFSVRLSLKCAYRNYHWVVINVILAFDKHTK